MIPSTYDASNECKEYIYCVCYCVVDTIGPGPNIYYCHENVVTLELILVTSMISIKTGIRRKGLLRVVLTRN